MRKSTRFLFLALVASLLPAGCKLYTTPHLSVKSIFLGGSVSVYSVPLDWNSDGTAIVFGGSAESGSSPDIYRVSPSPGSQPVRMTAYDEASSTNGGYLPTCLENGKVAYYNGWNGADHNLHIWIAQAAMADNSPQPAVLHAFNNSDLGTNSFTPERLSLCGDGHIAALTTESTCYVLTWNGGTLAGPALELSGCAEGALSRDGSLLAYRKNGNICYRPVGGDDASEVTVGAGYSPSWATAGRLGFVSDKGYNVYYTNDKRLITYAAGGASLQNAGISWDATKVAFRTFSGMNTGLSVATLVD